MIDRSLMEAVLRNDFPSFIQRCFYTVVPEQEFQMNWHIDALAHTLECVRRGEIKRLLILVGPRSLKSIIVSVAWPAWLLMKRPSDRIVCASYSQELASKMARDCRAVLESSWYRAVAPGTRLSFERNAVNDFTTTRRGGRIATSVAGTLTGLGGSTVIIDDILNAQDGLSEAIRRSTNDWFRNSLLSRLDNKAKDAMVVVQQRIHEEDLAGLLLEDASWHVIDLPAIATTSSTFPLTLGRWHHRREGDVLHPQRESRETLEALRASMGSYAFEAQYQQRPAPLGGGIVKLTWFKRNTTPLPVGNFQRIVQSWDIAHTESKTADYSACLTFGEKDGQYHLLNVRRERWEYPVLKRFIVTHALEWRASPVLIEQKGAGEPLLQELRSSSINAIGRKVDGSKEQRMTIATPAIEAGKVYLPCEADWLAEFEREIALFPRAKHDDQVDALSQYLLWRQERPRDELRIR